MNNSNYYRGSYALAHLAHEVYCQNMMKDYDCFCDCPTSCEICAFRFLFAIEFDPKIHMKVLKQLNDMGVNLDYMSDREQEKRVLEILENKAKERLEIMNEYAKTPEGKGFAYNPKLKLNQNWKNYLKHSNGRERTK